MKLLRVAMVALAIAGAVSLVWADTPKQAPNAWERLVEGGKNLLTPKSAASRDKAKNQRTLSDFMSYERP